jgi:hypothetical protein
MASSFQSSFQATEETKETLDELRTAFGVSTNSAVIRRALALAKVIAKEASDDHTIEVLGKDGQKLKILLNG